MTCIAQGRVEIRVGDCRTLLRAMPADSVDCVVTSPPYFGLRDYGGGAAEIGKEPTPAEFIAALVDVFREVRRVLKPSGTAWVNLGDSYAGSWGAEGRRDSSTNVTRQARNQIANHPKRATRRPDGFKAKDLMMLPARLAIALCDDGWRLRSDIIWHKPNAMPESITDRPTSAHEHVFLLTKARRYFYDAAAIAEPAAAPEGSGAVRPNRQVANGRSGENANLRGSLHLIGPRPTRNARNVWTIATEPFTGAHYAVMPTKLAERCILAGCPRGGLVLDPFGGAGTTGLVAARHGRHAILLELSPKHAETARARIEVEWREGRATPAADVAPLALFGDAQ